MIGRLSVTCAEHCPWAVLALVLLALSTTGARASEGEGVIWSAPETLSGPTSVIQMTALAADPWGGVHVFWVQGATGDLQRDTVQNFVYYTGWDGQAWSTPRDVVVGPEWASYYYPEATVDAAGTVYLTWAGPDGLYFTTAPATEAANANRWPSPVVVARMTRPGRSSMAVDGSGVLHLVYAEENPGSNVMHLSTDDGGRTWSEPVAVSGLYPGDPQAPDLPRLVVDSRGTLHVVWAENYPPDWAGRRVFYAHSEDGGNSWTLPFALSESSVGTDKWNARANLAVDRADRLHVVWVCEMANRCYCRSDDGGSTWSGAQRLFGSLLGVSGHDDLASDAYGHVYWLGALRAPQGVYFSALSRDGAWRDPPMLVLDEPRGGSLGQAHFFHLVVGQGNTLHTVMVAGDKGPVWYMRGQTSLPGIEAAPPAPTATEVPPSPTLVPPTRTAQPTPTEAVLVQGPDQTNRPEVSPLIMGVAAAAAVLFVAAVYQAARSRR